MNLSMRLFVFLILIALGLRTLVTEQSSTVFLERGQRGLIPCSVLPSFGIPSEDLAVRFVYWHFRRTDQQSLLISYFLGDVAPQNEIPVGVYNITTDGNFSLVVENVTDSDAGTYFCSVKPTNKALAIRNVSVAIKVSPKEPFPDIIDCNRHLPGNPLECDASIPYDSRQFSLTCVVQNVKPAVEIQWFWIKGEYEEKQQSEQTIAETTLPPNSQEEGWFQINNTYTTSATISVSPYENVRYRCEVYGDALGNRKGSHVTANIIVKGPPTHRSGTAIGTTPSGIETTTISSTESPHLPLLVSVPLGFLGLLALLLLTFLVTGYIKNKKRRRRQNVDSNTGPTGQVDFPLIGDVDLQGLKEILKPLFKATMQNISVDPSEEDQADAMHTEEIFIELELHDEKNNKVKVIESREDLIELRGGPQNRRYFVVKGAAGCGKTTLVRRFGFDWTNNSEYMQQFELVFVLKLKEMTDNPGLLSAILGQNIPRERAMSKESLLSVINQSAEKSLIILDGLDEMNLKVLNKPAPPGDVSVKDILAVKAFTNSCVIVTARPHMVKQLNKLNDNPVLSVIETTGFSDQNRNKYIRQRFREDPDKAEGLIQQIETAAFLEILAKVPIMLRLLCYLWKNKGESEVLPTRITELYGRVIDALVKHWEKKYKKNLQEKGEGWLEKVQEDLGKVAFEGLMDSKEGKLVFPREQFPVDSLRDAQELGFFSEKPDSKEPMVTFTHKTFQEYFASFFLVRQSTWFIKRKFLSKVTIDTVQEVEYLLRFSCGMNKELASVIFEHVRGIKDELISDRYLWVQHLTLMLYYEAQSESLEAGVGSRLALKYKEEFEALKYYKDNIPRSQEVQALNGSLRKEFKESPLRHKDLTEEEIDEAVETSFNIQPKVHLERLEVYLHVIKDQSKVRSILEEVAVDYLYFGLLVSDGFGEELKQLGDTISNLRHKPAGTIVCIAQKEQQSDSRAAAMAADQQEGLGSLLDPLVEFCSDPSRTTASCSSHASTASTSSYVCGFGLRIECNLIRTPDAFSRIANSLGESKAVYFGVLDNNLNGYMSSLDSLIPTLKYLELYDCGLKSEDLMSLAELMPSAKCLHELYISGATFSREAVESLLLKLKECPQMLMLELHKTGLLPLTVQAVVKKSFPEMAPVAGTVEGQFWLQKPRCACRLHKALGILRNWSHRFRSVSSN